MRTIDTITGMFGAGWEDFIIPVTSGIFVTIIIGGVRAMWSRRRVPTAISRRVRRETYLDTVRTESAKKGTERIDVVAPNLAPASEKRTRDILETWTRINENGRVRVVTHDSEDNIRGGVELLNRGIAVRVAEPELGMGNFSFHLFSREPAADSTVIVNHRVKGKDRPARQDGIAATQILGEYYQQVWTGGQPLEAVLAKRICGHVAEPGDPASVQAALRGTERLLGIDLGDAAKVLPHLAFGNGCQVVFILGLPGAGKSLVRRSLADRLEAMGIRTAQLSDYSFIYGGYVRDAIKLEQARGGSFIAHPAGAFEVDDIAVLGPALQELAQAVRVSVKEHSRVALVEFARPNLLTALREFEDLRPNSQVVYVNAPAQLRAERLNRRVEPHQVVVSGSEITIRTSDNHLLPPSANQAIYGKDNIDDLKADTHWNRRVFQIRNDVDDSGAKIQARLEEFVENVIGPYRSVGGQRTRP
ncbi:AAA family ATPase [Nonomuraea sp. FMUSA5-5]|uniref:AAA family ATPase n=1 Tax=Nonomuraea composti TaxID=2720023 RepID=A0ABX1B136_9ACTN|nr:AAA family ATPase [Nonomuraea sp. FMUSA5-5]NJP89404.1 AAA family ATPase [Nonomuraea sp. FMUSA5-5]